MTKPIPQSPVIDIREFANHSRPKPNTQIATKVAA